MTNLPKPPDGYDSWIEYAIHNSTVRYRAGYNARAELAELRLDSARLDWMMKNCIGEDSWPMYESREKIDAAMKGEKT